jgi:hypothetical protein
VFPKFIAGSDSLVREPGELSPAPIASYAIQTLQDDRQGIVGIQTQDRHPHGY